MLTFISEQGGNIKCSVVPDLILLLNFCEVLNKLLNLPEFFIRRLIVTSALTPLCKHDNRVAKPFSSYIPIDFDASNIYFIWQICAFGDQIIVAKNYYYFYCFEIDPVPGTQYSLKSH